jgi:putative restriction endonuclease
VALRLVNYAACDPYIRETGRTGMTSGMGKCMPFWNYFSNNKEELFLRAEEIKAKLAKKPIEQLLSLSTNDFIGKERETVIRQRVNQNSFRSMILANYNEICAITRICLPQLLIASHIIPWSDNNIVLLLSLF